MTRSLLLTALLFAPTLGSAHQNSRTVVELRVRGNEVLLTLRATPSDLAPLLEVGAGVRPLPELYRLKRETVLRNAAAYLTLGIVDGSLCPLKSKELRRADAEALELQLSYGCPRRPDQLELRYDLLFDDDPLHRAFVVAPEEPQQPHALLSSGERSFRLSRQLSVWQHAASYLRLGVEHIFSGYDHLCFLFGLLLCAAAARGAGARERFVGVLAIVTAFTVAHSITLIAAALEVLRLPARVVEPAIAMSILYVGVENLVRPEPRRRWLLAFVFGLVHGFGFAHLLRQVGLPRRGLLLSLLSFNAGVEVGQVAITAVLLPVLIVLFGPRAKPRRAIYLGASALLALLGAIWTVQRLAGR